MTLFFLYILIIFQVILHKSIWGWAFQEPVAVELATNNQESPAVGTRSRWVLEMEVPSPIYLGGF